MTKTGATEVAATVAWATAPGTATAGATCAAGVDYISDSGSLTFGPLETTKTITVKVCGETAVESNETFFVNLSTPGNATITDPQGLGTIVNDDVSFSINDISANEGSGPGTTAFTFTVTKTGTVSVPGPPTTPQVPSAARPRAATPRAIRATTTCRRPAP